MTHGSLLTQPLFLRVARRAAFIDRWNRSHILLACGWYAVVQQSFTPRLSATAAQSSDVNCAQRSEEMSDDLQKWATQVPMNALATSADVADGRGTASGQRVVLSTMVRR